MLRKLKGGEKEIQELFTLEFSLRKSQLKTIGIILSVFVALLGFAQGIILVVVLAAILAVIIWKAG